MTTEEQIIKSKHRVQKHGEVFTPSWMVQKMLDTPGVKEACENPIATFLEPSAGEYVIIVSWANSFSNKEYRIYQIKVDVLYRVTNVTSSCVQYTNI